MIRQRAPAAWALQAGQLANGKMPCLTVLTGGPVGVLYTLSASAATLIGRARDANVRLTNKRASRRHAKILINPEGRAILEDLGSRNGTYINGKQVRSYRLRDGDKLRLGPDAVLKFSYQDDLERNVHQSLIDGEIRDAVTGIYTKRFVFDQIVTACAHARRYDTPLTLLIFEIDHFWQIEDMYDRPAGNYIVRKLSRIVRRLLRTDDVFARYDTHRFVVLARDLSNEGAVMLARRIRRAVRSRQFNFQDMHLPVSISLGIGRLSDEANEPASLLHSAEGFLRMAKTAGGGAIAGRGVQAYQP